jgi:hypothetical protein
METNNETNKNCGCSDGNCCPPERKPKWRMVLAILLLLIAFGIIGFKVVSMSNKPAPAANDSTRCDTTGKVACDTTKGSSCCSKTGN